MTRVLLKRRNLDAEAHRRKTPWEGSLGQVHLQAKERQRLLEARRMTSTGPFLVSSEVARPCGYHDFRCLISKTVSAHSGQGTHVPFDFPSWAAGGSQAPWSVTMEISAVPGLSWRCLSFRELNQPQTRPRPHY